MTTDDTPMTPLERALAGLTMLIGAAALTCVLCALGGCKAFYENAGAHVRTGSITAPIEVSEPTSSINVRALYAMDGIDFYAAKNCNVKMWYTNDYTNTYFGIVETRGRQSSRVEIEPTETSSGETERGNPKTVRKGQGKRTDKKRTSDCISNPSLTRTAATRPP